MNVPNSTLAGSQMNEIEIAYCTFSLCNTNSIYLAHSLDFFLTRMLPSDTPSHGRVHSPGFWSPQIITIHNKRQGKRNEKKQ